MNKPELVHGLMARLDAADESYLRGQMDRDTWAKELQEVDGMLNVVGLRMTFRPWEGPAPTATPKPF